MASDMSSDFQKQLDAFKTTLISMYRKKTKAVAAREAIRFQYITALKAKFQGIVSEILSKAFSDQNPNASNLLRRVLWYVMSQIPMASNVGTSVEGWGSNPGNVGGPLGLGFLSPTSQFLSEPFWGVGQEDKTPGYKLYGNSFLEDQSMSVQGLLDYYFVGGMYTALSNTEDNTTHVFSFPLDVEWLKAYARTIGTEQDEVMNAFGYIKNAINMTTANGTLESAVEELKNVFIQIVEQTKGLIQLQLDLDAQEANLSDFVNAYRDYLGTTATVEDMLEQLKVQANTPEVVEQAKIEAVQAIDQASTKKPNWLFVGAAVVGAYLLSKDK